MTQHPCRRAASLAALFAWAALTAGCSKGEPPARSWTQAQGLYTAALSRGSTFSIVGSLNHGGSLWRTSDAERLYDWNHRAGEYSDLVAAAFSPDGTRAVTTDPRTLVLWDTTSGHALGFWATPGSVTDIALGRDGHTALVGQNDHSALVFDAMTGAYGRTFLHEGTVNAVDLSDDGRHAVTGSDDLSARVWDLSTGEERHRFEHPAPVRLVALSPNSRYVFTSCARDEGQVWDVVTGQRVLTLGTESGVPGRLAEVTAATFSDDDRHLIVGDVQSRIALWDIETGTREMLWRAKSADPWQSFGHAVLAVGFGATPGVYYALAGDGRMSELRESTDGQLVSAR